MKIRNISRSLIQSLAIDNIIKLMFNPSITIGFAHNFKKNCVICSVYVIVCEFVNVEQQSNYRLVAYT